MDGKRRQGSNGGPKVPAAVSADRGNRRQRSTGSKHPLPTPATIKPAREPGRVHWMELFFDLVFVAFVGQLTHGIHGDPGWAEFGTFVLLFFPAWWAWANIVSVINLLPDLSARALGLAMLCAMAASELMAASAPEAFGERAWAFSLANAGLRVLLLVLWLRQHRDHSGAPTWRIWIYNGGTATLWLAAALLPLPAAGRRRAVGGVHRGGGGHGGQQQPDRGRSQHGLHQH